MEKIKEIKLVNHHKAWTYLFSLVLMFITFNSKALQRDPNDPWWFEVEAIIFERDISPEEINEVFDLSVNPIETQNLESFTFAALQPDISLLQQSHRTCGQSELPIAFPKQTAAPAKIRWDLMDANLSELIVLTEEKQGHKLPVLNQTVLDQANLRSPEFILEARPSEKLWQLLTNPFTGFERELTRRIDTQLTTSIAPKYEMFTVKSDTFENTFALPDTLLCQWPAEKALFVSEESQLLKESRFLNYIKAVPDGIEYPYSELAYTLPADNLQLTSLKRSIQRRRGLNVLLHTAWRQDVKIGRDNAPWYRLIAGINHSRDYTYTGIPINQLTDEQQDSESNEQDIVSQVMAIISEPDVTSDTKDVKTYGTEPKTFRELANSELNERFQEVWTLDGRLKIFIEYIGGTPYLHIDSELNYRVPVFVDWQALDEPVNIIESEELADENSISPSPNMLQPFYFDQLRRVISNEIHYLDHPLFGMVFQVRRYKRPEPPEPDEFGFDQAEVGMR